MGPVLTSRPIREGEAGAFEALLGSHPAGRAVVPRWDELAGWTSHEIGAFAGGQLVGGLIYAIRRIPALPLCLGRITCVLIGPPDAARMLELLLEQVERVSLRRLVVETELRLRIPATSGLVGFEYRTEVARIAGSFGYRALSKTDSTYVAAIDRSDEELLASFEATTRNRIKKAKKNGAVVATSRDPLLMERFYDAYLEMGHRKRAPIAPKALVVQGLRPLIEAERAFLFTESYGAHVSNMVIVDALGVPCYIFGTRTEANVKGDVPSAAQVLHYEIMRFFRERGKRHYDLGGCEGPTPIEGHPNFGVWRFKHGFRAPYVEFLPYLRKTRGPLSRPILELAHGLRGDYT